MSKGFSFSRGLQPSFQVDSQKSQVLWCQWGTWVCQEMVHLKPGAEIAKKFSGNAQPVGWAKQSDAEANCAEALCWPTIGISKFFFFLEHISAFTSWLTWLYQYFTTIPCLGKFFPVSLTCHSSLSFSIRDYLCREGAPLFLLLVPH